MLGEDQVAFSGSCALCAGSLDLMPTLSYSCCVIDENLASRCHLLLLGDDQSQS